MTEADAREAILQHWKDGWEALHPVDVPWTPDNEIFAAVATWVRITIKHTTSRQLTMGEAPHRKWERLGTIGVRIFTPPNAGARPRAILADDVRTVLEGASIGTTPRITTYEGPTAVDGADDGAWSVSEVIVPFRYVTTR